MATRSSGSGSNLGVSWASSSSGLLHSGHQQVHQLRLTNTSRSNHSSPNHCHNSGRDTMVYSLDYGNILPIAYSGCLLFAAPELGSVSAPCSVPLESHLPSPPLPNPVPSGFCWTEPTVSPGRSLARKQYHLRPVSSLNQHHYSSSGGCLSLCQGSTEKQNQ